MGSYYGATMPRARAQLLSICQQGNTSLTPTRQADVKTPPFPLCHAKESLLKSEIILMLRSLHDTSLQCAPAVPPGSSGRERNTFIEKAWSGHEGEAARRLLPVTLSRSCANQAKHSQDNCAKHQTKMHTVMR